MPSSTLKDLDKTAWGWVEYTDPKLISSENLSTAYRITQNYCKGKSCRRNCRGNPFCLAGLGESRLVESLKHSTDDTSNTLLPKRINGNYVGLKNLGATCYVNSLLQLWFHIKAFRNAIFLWNPLEDPGEQSNSTLYSDGLFSPQTDVGHLQQLFALMYYSKCRYIDPTPLIESLRLDTSTQQDAQEFSKLFVSLLERALSHQSLLHVRNLIGDIFRGEFKYVTRCCNCLTESVSHSMFYELELNVKGHNTLTECLAEFLSEEKLEGANCYSCVVCQSKQEASRFIRLCSLPPVLNLQLLRFVYDREKSRRKKLKNVVQFPETLDMKEFVKTDSEEPMLYNLSAVLIHKGAHASSGHFIAYIKNEETGSWNTFNDETVEKLEGKKLKLDEEDLETQNKSKMPRLPKGFQSSTDAYMLVYTSVNHNTNMPSVPLSIRLQQYVDSRNKDFDDLYAEIANSKKQGLDRQEQLLREYQSLAVESPSSTEHIDVITVEWLTAWLENKPEVQKEIDNSKLVCPHGRLDPCAITSAKYVDSSVAVTLYERYGGGPRFRVSESLCEACVKNYCLVTRTKTKTLDESKEITNLLRKRMAVDEPGFYVDKYSLKTWRTKVLSTFERNCCKLSKKNGASLVLNDDSETHSGESLPKSQLSLTCCQAKNTFVEKEIKSSEVILKRRQSINRCLSAIQRRKQSVNVPLSEIRECFVICQRLELGLEKQDISEGKILLDRCKKLKGKLRKLTLPTKSVKLLRDLRLRSIRRPTVETSVAKFKVEQSNDENKSKPSSDVESSESCNRNKQSIAMTEGNNQGSYHLNENKEKVVTTEDDEGGKTDDGCDTSIAFNEQIRCPHGNLSLDQTERKLVPVRVWEILKQYFPSAPEFPCDTEPCLQCQNLASKDQVVKQLYYESALNQKKTFYDLLHMRNRPVLGKTEDTIFVLHKYGFFQQWSAFIKSATRRDGASVTDPPASLQTDSLFCYHGLLLYSPQYEEDKDRLVLLTRQEWQELISLYTTEHEVTVLPDLTTSPELCQTCFAARLENEQLEKFNYERAKLNIRVVPPASSLEDLTEDFDTGSVRKRPRVEDGSTSPIPPELKKLMKSSAIAMASAGAVAGAGSVSADVRRSARNRKVPGQKEVNFYVASSLTLRGLKEKITSTLAVAPFDQHLYTMEGRELQGDSNTLSSLGILPNSTLLLQVDEPKESFEDVLEECSKPTEPETGFKGTGLLHAY